MAIPYNPRPPVSCSTCHFLPDCGGLEGDALHRGCFRRCVERCANRGCDLACPCLHFDFADMVEDAGGFWAPPTVKLKAPHTQSPPPYLTEMHHGSSRKLGLREDFVAVPLSAVLRKSRKGRVSIPYASADSFRDALRLSRQTKVLLVSVCKDQPLEDFWEVHVSRDLVSDLAQLDLWGMTVPNFSFMSDVPRLNSILNLSRMFRVAERLTTAGVATILHLQASTRFDWAKWRDVFRDQDGARYIATEFLTGTSTRDIGDRYYYGLLGLQEALGRPLHPLAVGGGGRLRALRKDFASFTVIDSIPFMKSMHRRALKRLPSNIGWRWIKHELPEGHQLDDLMTLNIRNYRRRLLDSVGMVDAWGDEGLFSSAA